MSQHADQHFDKISKKYVDLRPIHPPLLNELANILNLRQGVSVLDLGCGPGHDLEFFIQQFGVTGQGIDKSKGMVEVAHERYNRTFVLQADALNYLQHSKRNYDAVLLKFFAHHITDHYDLFESIYFALASKGKVAIVTMRENDLNTFPLLKYLPSLSHYMKKAARKLSMIPSLLQEVGFIDCSEVPVEIGVEDLDKRLFERIECRYISFLNHIPKEELKNGLKELNCELQLQNKCDHYSLQGVIYHGSKP